MRWHPALYGHHAGLRGRPFMDLVGRIGHDAPRSVVDLGCGPGDLTEMLAIRWPDAAVRGIDASRDMIDAAGHRPPMPNLSFEAGDLRHYEPGGDDVVVTNAALQWVPGHQDLLAAWAEGLSAGGWLAMQVPGNFSAPSHTLLRLHAANERWKDRLHGVLRHDDAVGEPPEYLHILLSAGLEADVWETTYQQVLQGEDAVLDWMRGAGLRPILDALSAEEGGEFEAGYGELLRAAYPRSGHGTVFGFRRLFAVGYRAA
ncbi:methyltransferase domain-containing protein [Arthrobacter cheniae]|uniref:Methyltransferase domain-containing protein n=1 Tax=Arthrobacter cheniae TaxID=1258888 RepID=A0A3A5M4Y4_9MICC|nr:methyltransferase domain-containing protein [Arthrobacter cheniae]RJT79064.1 methyltransferase domain-containing protein [Arthrobacter cheniae]